jgi:hypothetical protein
MSSGSGRRGFATSIASSKAYSRGDHLHVSWVGVDAGSVRVATSTSAQPAAGSGTLAAGASGTFDCGAFAYGDTIYVTITPYSEAAGAGIQGATYRAIVRFAFREDFFSPSTGAPRRTSPFDDGKYALKAADTAGKETDDDLFIASSKTVKVGTVASPASLSKTLRIPHTELLPESSAQSWFVLNAFTRPNTANVVVILRGAVVLPKGVTITDVAARMYRQSSTNDQAACAVVRINDDGTTTGLATINHSGTGWNTNSQSVSQLVGDEAYSIEVQLRGQAAVTDARFMWLEITYTMPSYDKGI